MFRRHHGSAWCSLRALGSSNMRVVDNELGVEQLFTKIILIKASL